eukprot:CAMPEP_0183352242 /NCGR_PEP_ID=MMETSP0164_2-20130417/28694_1 /TAXON_ID=221442 /ORGANISM="Coccolithus pelagicus ssp braarudi, Strain PLY182g" /LENGTH=30 /DNA_ID= /DNA_START= /DNA_END= /DNA_ORIENTATION=
MPLPVLREDRGALASFVAVNVAAAGQMYPP